MNIKQLLEERKRLSEVLSDRNKAVTEIKSQIDQVEKELKHRMDKEGIEKTAVEGLSVTLNHEMVPKVLDWDQLYNYVHEKKAYSLLHKRVSTQAFKSMVANGDILPGVQVETFDKLSFRRI